MCIFIVQRIRVTFNPSSSIPFLAAAPFLNRQPFGFSTQVFIFYTIVLVDASYLFYNDSTIHHPYPIWFDHLWSLTFSHLMFNLNRSHPHIKMIGVPHSHHLKFTALKTHFLWDSTLLFLFSSVTSSCQPWQASQLEVYPWIWLCHLGLRYAFFNHLYLYSNLCTLVTVK